MKKTIFFFITLLPCLLFTQTKNSIVSGKIIDKESKTPLEYATISIYKSGDSIVKYGGVSNSKGDFEIEVSNGSYDFKIDYISFNQKLISDISVLEKTSLGLIEMTINENILDQTSLVVIGDHLAMRMTPELNKKYLPGESQHYRTIFNE